MCLWRQVLERGQEISKRDWRVVRVAIVELRQQTYIGRLFFGDDAGVVMWDCDCRPSDGCWLALKVWASPSAHNALLSRHTTAARQRPAQASPQQQAVDIRCCACSKSTCRRLFRSIGHWLGAPGRR